MALGAGRESEQIKCDQFTVLPTLHFTGCTRQNRTGLKNTPPHYLITLSAHALIFPSGLTPQAYKISAWGVGF